MQKSYSTPVKQYQNPSNQAKSHNQSRQGDWVCFNCSNLNFSFRKKCNRCKTQTKKQNQQLQNAYTYYYYSQQQPENNPYYGYQVQSGYENQQHVDCNNLNQTNMNQKMIQNVDSLNVNNDVNICNNPLSFSRNNYPSSVASPFKQLTSNDYQQEQVTTNTNTDKKLFESPKSKRKSTNNKKNDFLPSISPLLKRILAKEDLLSKQKQSTSKKDPLNVALFYDEIWDSNKQNVSVKQSLTNGQKSYEKKKGQMTYYQQTSSLKHPFSQLTNLSKHQYQQNRSLNEPYCMTICNKKMNENVNIQDTNDSLGNKHEDDIFSYLIRSPLKQFNNVDEKDNYQDQIIEINQDDQELAHIISRIMI